MKLLEKILMPVDINKKYNEQIAFATKLSKEFHSEVLVMYVLPEEDIHPEIDSLLNTYVSEILNKVIDELKSNKVPCREPIVVKGNPTDKILQEANEQNVNLILTGSGNKSEKDEFKLGTTGMGCGFKSKYLNFKNFMSGRFF